MSHANTCPTSSTIWDFDKEVITMKRIMKNTFTGMGISLIIFAVIGIAFDIGGGGEFSMSGYGFTKMILGCLFTGIGFGLPSGVYENERLSTGAKVLIHMGIGCTVYTAAAFFAGWIPRELGAAKCALIILAELATAFLIWTGFYIFNVKTADRMNERIKKLNR